MLNMITILFLSNALFIGYLSIISLYRNHILVSIHLIMFMIHKINIYNILWIMDVGHQSMIPVYIYPW